VFCIQPLPPAIGIPLSIGLLIAAALACGPDYFLALVPVICTAPVLHYTNVSSIPSLNYGDVMIGGIVACLTAMAPHRLAFSGTRPAVRVLLLGFLLLNFASLLLSPDRLATARALGTLFVASLVAIHLAQSSRRVRGTTVYVLAATALFNASVAEVQHLSASPLWMGRYIDAYHLSELNVGLEAVSKAVGLTTHGNALAVILTLSAPYLVLVLAPSRNMLRIGCLAVLATGGIASLSRGGLLAWIAECGVMAIIMMRHRILSWQRILVIASVGLIALAVISLGAFGERFRSADMSARDANADNARIACLEAGIAATIASPLTGIGAGLSDKVFFRYGGWRNLGPHNLYLLLSAERGLPSLVVFLCLLLFLFRLGVGGAFRPLAIASAVALAGLCVHGLFESFLVDCFQYLVFIVIGLAATSSQSSPYASLKESRRATDMRPRAQACRS